MHSSTLLIGSLLTRKLAAAKEKLEKQQGEGERVAALEEQVRDSISDCRLQNGIDLQNHPDMLFIWSNFLSQK